MPLELLQAFTGFSREFLNAVAMPIKSVNCQLPAGHLCHFGGQAETGGVNIRLYLGVFFFIYLFKFIYLFEREGKGGRKEGERNVNWLPLACVPTRDQAHNPGRCLDQESNW